jgi:thioester reductase-like protein
VRTLMSRRDLASLAAEAATLLALQAGSVDDEAGVRREVPDFAAESVLEAAVRFPPRRSAFPAHGSPSASGGVVPPRSVLLTGATGFLGAHLVRELLDQTSASIHCLARAQDDAHAQRRVLDAVRGYGLPLTEADEARIIGVTGDLGADRFGLTPSRFGELAASTDVVLHNGAWVNFLYPYSTLRQVNVGGTREIIRFSAAGSSIPVHYVSTQAVFTSLGVKGMRRVEEHTVPAHPELLFMGYAETKSVSETLLRQAAQRGMSLSIYRPHDVTGHSVTGRWNPESFLFKLLRSFVDLGAAPDFRLPLDFVPVDVVASTIVALVTGLPAVGSAFHLSNPDHPLLPDLVSRFNEAGHKIESLPLEKWTDLLIGHCARHEDTPLAPFASLFTERWGPERLTLAEFYLEGRMPEQSSTLTWEAARRAGGPPGPPPADVLLESCVQEITQPQR